MKWILRVFAKFQAVGLFVSGFVNYVLLLIVYILGVGLAWCLVRFAKKEMLEGWDLKKKSFWHGVSANDASLDRAKRLF